MTLSSCSLIALTPTELKSEFLLDENQLPLQIIKHIGILNPSEGVKILSQDQTKSSAIMDLHLTI